jgi:hypothetical protein
MNDINLCSFAGFGDATMTPAPPVGFNLTFVCPRGQVFESNWLAIPFVMMTCQVRKKRHQCKISRPVDHKLLTFKLLSLDMLDFQNSIPRFIPKTYDILHLLLTDITPV